MTRSTIVDSSDNSSSPELVKVFPVPAKNILNVQINSPSADNAAISIYDANGRQILKSNNSLQPGQNNFTFNVSGFASGIYFMKINGANISAVKKVLIVP
ncbi:MAG TPA: T9SS type A sorting domain-containing protein [Puia sp.]|nr:T9SS type A sorting domain-containing protein [Puia sp.]